MRKIWMLSFLLLICAYGAGAAEQVVDVTFWRKAVELFKNDKETLNVGLYSILVSFGSVVVMFVLNLFTGEGTPEFKDEIPPAANYMKNRLDKKDKSYSHLESHAPKGSPTGLISIVAPAIAIFWIVDRIRATKFYLNKNDMLVFKVPEDTFNAQEVLIFMIVMSVVFVVFLGFAADKD